MAKQKEETQKTQSDPIDAVLVKMRALLEEVQINAAEQAKSEMQARFQQMLGQNGHSNGAQIARDLNKPGKKKSEKTEKPEKTKRGPINITCPYPGCTNQGVRPFGNFCKSHNESLNAEEKSRYRAQQKESKKNPEAEAA